MTLVADADLIEAFLRRRDERSFDALYGKYADRHYRFLMRLTSGDRELSNDLFQDTWIVALTRLSRFEGRSAFYTWLVGISVNLCRSFWRSSRREDELSEVPDPRSGSAREALLDARSILEKLSPGYRAVLVLHVEGYTHEEIGEILSISDGTSKSQLARARQAAQRWLKGESR